MVQAPLFVDDAAYGALVVTSDALTPTLAGTIEMFAGLVARAIENVRANGRALARLEDLERLQGELVERERLAALGEAAAVMAHEVRNPIAAILNAVAVLRRGDPGEAPDAEMYRVIAEEAARLGQLVSNLLDLGRPLLPRVCPVDLGELTARSADVLVRRGGAAGCTVHVDAERARAVAAVDPDLVQLALLNVIQNAVQASPGGRVRVGIELRGELAAVVVDDSGPGFSAAVASRMFEPFFTTRARWARASASRWCAASSRPTTGRSRSVAARWAGGAVPDHARSLSRSRKQTGKPNRNTDFCYLRRLTSRAPRQNSGLGRKTVSYAGIAQCFLYQWRPFCFSRPSRIFREDAPSWRCEQATRRRVDAQWAGTAAFCRGGRTAELDARRVGANRWGHWWDQVLRLSIISVFSIVYKAMRRWRPQPDSNRCCRRESWDNLVVGGRQ